MNTTHIMTANPYYCKFASLLKFIFNHKINACDVFAIIHRYVQNGGKGLLPDMHTASLIQSPIKGDSLPSCFNSQNANKCPLAICLLPRFSHFCVFCWWLLCLKWPSTARWSVVYYFQNSRKLWLALQRKCMLTKYHSQHELQSCSFEFNVNESAIDTK